MSLEVKPGETVVLGGPRGAGKTTPLRLITGEARATRGSVLVLEEDVVTLRRRGLARLRREMGIVPQDRRLLADRTVFGNVSLGLRALGHRRTEARARAREALEEVGLTAQRNLAPAELAEGDRLRLCLARAVAPEPRLLLLDEPVTGLDGNALAELVDLLRRRHEHGATIVLATQATDLAGRLDARRIILDRGRLRAEGGTH